MRPAGSGAMHKTVFTRSAAMVLYRVPALPKSRACRLARDRLGDEYMNLSRGVAIAAIGLVGGLAACGSSSTAGNKGTIKIGVDLPESGNETSNGIPTLNGVKFAVQEAGSIKGFTLAVENKDDAVNGAHDPQKGVQNVRDLIADTAVLAMIGPFNSSVAR